MTELILCLICVHIWKSLFSRHVDTNKTNSWHIHEFLGTYHFRDVLNVVNPIILKSLWEFSSKSLEALSTLYEMLLWEEPNRSQEFLNH